MSRPSVLSPLLTKLIASATAPGYLLQIDFSTVYRWSTRGTLTWGGNSFTAHPFDVGLTSDKDGAQKLSLSMRNHDNAIGTLLLGDGIANRDVTLWAFTGDSPSSGDAIEVFSGVGDSFTVDRRTARIECAPLGQDVIKVPSQRIVRSAIRQRLIDPGTRVAWGVETYKLESR